MKILLTGSRGYIGTVMAPFLVNAGHEVTGLDTDLYRRSTFGPWRESITTIVKDLRAIEAKDLRGHDAVVHLAALSNDPLGDLLTRGAHRYLAEAYRATGRNDDSRAETQLYQQMIERAKAERLKSLRGTP